jgi:hypothetical protein
MALLLAAVSRVTVYGLGTFYCFPHKLAVACLQQVSYPRAFTHFRYGHKHWVNLLAHIGCLVLQLVGNFAFLEVLGQRLPVVLGGGGGGLLAVVTAWLWMAMLWRTPAPVTARVVAVASIAVACAARHTLLLRWRLLLPLHAGLQGVCMWYTALALLKQSPRQAVITSAVFGCAVWFAYLYGTEHWDLVLADDPPIAANYTAAFAGLCAVLSLVRRCNEPVCETFCGMLGWAVSMATGDPTAVLLTSSYVTTLTWNSFVQSVLSLY